MTTIIGILCIICIGQAIYIHHVRRQLSEWLNYLKNNRNVPEQKNFVKGEGILAEINYEINNMIEENRRQFLKLTKAEKANKQILTNLSHDIRTPLASLIGYLEALVQNRVRVTDQKEYTHIAYRKALNLKALVDILFEWFQINSKERNYQIEEYDVNELTRQMIIGFLPIVEREQINLEVHISDEEWFLFLDKLAYERIINNLFSNALKHGNCSKITVKIQKNESKVMIEISNNGVMIPKREIQYLFDRLYKGDAARSQNGNGLGLAITKELVTAMQGEITALSVPEKTSFYVVFPIGVRKK